jgi:hypothetical protein
MDSLRDLQAARQREHDEYVRVRKEQGWRDSCDPLRYQISEALERQVIAERDQQVIARDAARMRADGEEAKWADFVRADVRQFHEDERVAAEERQLKIRRNRENLLGEMRAHDARDERRREADREEGRQFRENAAQLHRDEQQRSVERVREQAARRRELDDLNAQQLGHKQRLVQEDKELDSIFAQMAAEQLRQEQEDKMVERVARVRKLAATERLLGSQLNKTRAVEAEAEFLLQQSQDEENRKEDEIRARDAAARKKLMMDAVAHRVDTMKLHDRQREERRAYKEVEKQELEEDLALKRQLDQEEYESKRRVIANQHQMLASQCRVKHELETRAKQEEVDFVNSMIQGWKDEEKRIQEELAHPHALEGGRFRGHR